MRLEARNYARYLTNAAREEKACSSDLTKRTILALSRLHPRNAPVKGGLLNPPAATYLNCRNLSALHEIVEARERKAQVIGRFFYSKQIVIWRFAHSLSRR